jgi:hypothetical protein
MDMDFAPLDMNNNDTMSKSKNTFCKNIVSITLKMYPKIVQNEDAKKTIEGF